MARQTSLPPSLPPRLISREAAAAYACLSPAKFDEMVRDGRMPRARCMDRRKAWDVRELDAAIDNLPVDGGEAVADETWDDIHHAA